MKGKVVLIADASNPTGRALAQLLAQRGAALALCTPGAHLDGALRQELESHGRRFRHIATDLASEEAIDHALNDITQALGGIDAVFFNRFSQVRCDLESVTQEAFARNYHHNIEAPLLLTKAAGNRMVRQGRGGKLVYVGSIHGEKPTGGAPLFSMAMAALQLLNREAALAYGPARIESLMIAAGPLEDEAPEQLPTGSHSTFYQGYRYKIPSCEVGGAKELAELAAWFIEGNSRYINGADIRLDGGLTLHYQDEKANARMHAREGGNRHG